MIDLMLQLLAKCLKSRQAPWVDWVPFMVQGHSLYLEFQRLYMQGTLYYVCAVGVRGELDQTFPIDQWLSYKGGSYMALKDPKTELYRMVYVIALSSDKDSFEGQVKSFLDHLGGVKR